MKEKSKTRRQVVSWCLYDFANSCYSAVIAAVIYPVYYVNVIVGNSEGLGDLWWGRAISTSMFIVALSAPFVGGIADYGGLRKKFLFVYTQVAVLSILALTLVEPGMVFTGFILIVFANTAFEGGLVFYNSYLNDIAAQDYRGRVSSWGFATGYIGSFLSLLIALPLVKAGRFDIVWVYTGMFYFIFSLPVFIFLPSQDALHGDAKENKGNIFSNITSSSAAGFKRTIITFKEIAKKRQIKRFLLSFLLYMDGVNTVIVFASIFAATTLGFKSEELIYMFLIIQLTAFAGALVMAKPVDIWGPKKVIILSLVLWSVVSIVSFFVHEKRVFFVVASVAGFGLGTVQSASRALFSMFIPKNRESEYFGVYSMIGKTSAILGPLLFGFVSVAFKSQRPAVLSIVVFFILGLLLISLVDEKKIND